MTMRHWGPRRRLGSKFLALTRALLFSNGPAPKTMRHWGPRGGRSLQAQKFAPLLRTAKVPRTFSVFPQWHNSDSSDHFGIYLVFSRNFSSVSGSLSIFQARISENLLLLEKN